MNQLTLFAGDSPASRSPSPEREPVISMTDGYGPRCAESLARLSQDGCWLKMYGDYCQPRMDGSLEEFSETWPSSGTLSNGIASRLPRLVPPISGTASGLLAKGNLLPTPNVPNGGRTTWHTEIRGNTAYDKDGKKVQLGLEQYVRYFPTPSANSYGSNQGGSAGRTGPVRHSLQSMARRDMWPTPDVGMAKGRDEASAASRSRLGGSLNPTWVEWLMGFPSGWTNLDA